MITDLFPKITPSLDLNFARAQKLDSRITFSRPSAATYFDRYGILRTAASGVPRFDFDPITGACKGLLIEGQCTNLLIYSEQFDNAAWGKSNATVSANAATAPDGTLTADKLVENTSTGQHRVTRTVSGTSNSTPYTVSFYAKASERTRVYVGMAESPTSIRQGNAFFDLSTGTVVSASGGSNGATGGAATILALGDGWYRCSYTLTLGGADTSIFADINIVTGTNTISYTGDGTSGIYTWGAQLETGSFPTSYIKTEASQATRSADVAAMTGANFSSWYRQDEGALVGDATTNMRYGGTDAFPRVLSVNDGTSDNRIEMVYGVLPTVIDNRPSMRAGGVGQVSFSSNTNENGKKQFFCYKTNDTTYGQAGFINATDTSCVVPVVSILRIGADWNGASHLNGHISRLAYYPKRLTNTELQALTA